jgi:flavin-dependent dehydrogenase
VRVDVLVVGAGPAGLAAALSARALGLEVAVIDRAAVPFEKVGETVPPGVWSLLRALGVADAVERAGFARVGGIHVRLGEATRLEPFDRRQGLGLQLERARFEALLEAAARARGVDVRRGVALRAVLRAGDRVVGARLDAREGTSDLEVGVLVDASGPARALARRLELRVERGPGTVGITGYVPSTSTRARDETVYEALDDGWLWSVQRADGLRNVTVGVDRDALRATRDPAAVHAAAWAQARVIPRGTREEAATPLVVHDATATWVERHAGPGWLLVGDAASTVDPLTAHGVVKALASGLRAGALARALLGDASVAADAEAFVAWSDREERARYAATTRALFEEAGHRGAPFWEARRAALAGQAAAPSDGLSRERMLDALTRGDGGETPIRTSEDLTLEVRPSLRRGRIERASRLVVGGWCADVPAELDEAALAAALGPPGSVRNATTLFEAYARAAGAEPHVGLAKQLTQALASLAERGGVAVERP